MQGHRLLVQGSSTYTWISAASFYFARRRFLSFFQIEPAISLVVIIFFEIMSGASSPAEKPGKTMSSNLLTMKV